ncbi:MAG: hypothetical protein K2I77_05700, partial [Anaeroplasmataceae bacterium]|nr:hypothetical protein [Anaeroplasmataceae bacterium]
MKKMVSIIFLLMIILTISSCDNNSSYSKKPKKDYYQLSVTSEIVDVLDLPENGYYKAGCILEIKAAICTDVGMYVYLNNEKMECEYEDDYLYWTFSMPKKDSTIHITRNEFYGKDVYAFEEVFSEVKFLNEENVIKIREELGYYGVSSENFTEISYTENPNDIKDILTIFDQPLKVVEYEKITGGGYRKYSFYEKNSIRYDLLISNGSIVLQYFSDAYFFKFDNTDFKFPKMKNKSNEYYSFNRCYETGKVYSYSDVKDLSKT